MRFTAEQKLKALNMLANRISIYEIAKQFNCYPRTIYLWKSIYDGTIESLQNATPQKKQIFVKHKKTTAEKTQILYEWRQLGGGDKQSKIIAQKYCISPKSIYHWQKLHRENGIGGLDNKSSKPHTLHPQSHTDKEIAHIERILTETPNLGLKKLYSKLRLECDYTRTEHGLYRFLQKNGYIDSTRTKPNEHEILLQIELLLLKIIPKEKAMDIIRSIKEQQ